MAAFALGQASMRDPEIMPIYATMPIGELIPLTLKCAYKFMHECPPGGFAEQMRDGYLERLRAILAATRSKAN